MAGKIGRFLLVAAAEGAVGGIAFWTISTLVEPGPGRNVVLLAIWPLVVICGTVVSVVWIARGNDGRSSAGSHGTQTHVDEIQQAAKEGDYRHEVQAAIALLTKVGGLTPSGLELLRIISSEAKHLLPSEYRDLRRWPDGKAAVENLESEGLLMQVAGHVKGTSEEVPVYYLSEYAERIGRALALLDVSYPEAHRTLEKQIAPTGYFSRDRRDPSRVHRVDPNRARQRAASSESEHETGRGNRVESRREQLGRLIEEGRELRTALLDESRPGHADSDNESFTQWQGGVMRWDERVQRKIGEIAPDRLEGYRLPVFLDRANAYPDVPVTVRNLAVELDTRIERLEIIRASLDR